MKALNYGLGLALVVGFAFSASCGGSSSGGGDSSAGESSSSAGASNQGTGSSSVAGDTSSAGGGNMVQGGGRGGMDRAGAPGSGGTSASNPADCPMENLAPNAMCTPLAGMERCMYADESCRCRPTNGGAGGAPATDSGRWACVTVCPTAKPTVGTDCTAGLACPYAGGNCFCGGGQKWQCNGGMAGGGGAGGGTGSAGAGGRSAAGGMTGGGAGGAANNGTACPPQKPMSMGACMGTGVCIYPNKTGCACTNDKWLCD